MRSSTNASQIDAQAPCWAIICPGEAAEGSRYCEPCKGFVRRTLRAAWRQLSRPTEWQAAVRERHPEYAARVYDRPATASVGKPMAKPAPANRMAAKKRKTKRRKKGFAHYIIHGATGRKKGRFPIKTGNSSNPYR